MGELNYDKSISHELKVCQALFLIIFNYFYLFLFIFNLFLIYF